MACRSESCVHAFSLAHVHLAQTLAFLGHEIRSGDRFFYILADRPGKRFVKAETLERSLANNLQADRLLYLLRLESTLRDFFEIVLGPTNPVLTQLKKTMDLAQSRVSSS